MRRTIIMIALMLAGTFCIAQKPLKQLPVSTVEAFRPEMVSGQVFSESMAATLVSKNYGQGNTSSNFVKTYWDAYSDRDDNLTYSTAKDKDVYSSLKFNEKVRIARIKGDFALVYSFDESEITYPFLPTEPVWKGWIPMSNLVLWDQCLTNEKGQKLKALISSAVHENSASSSVGKLFRNPTSPKTFTKLPSSEEVFYYILKKEGSMYLLSKKAGIGGESEPLYGWVDAGSLIVWDNNVCAEPTWSISKVKEFSTGGITCDLYDDLTQANKLGSISFSEREMPVYKTDFYRLPENSWRFPIMTYTPNHIRCAIPENDAVLDASSMATGAESDLDNINIVFVIDGSRSYEQYYPIIVEYLEGLKNKFGQYNLKAGAMIYRDVRNEDFMTEFCPLQDIRNRELLDFIDQGGEYGFKDNLSEPAMLNGINKVLDEVQFRPSETNIMIIIGGRGESSDAVGMNTLDLADRLDAANVSLYGIQIHNNPKSSANRLFNLQVSDLIYSKLMARAGKVGSATDAVVQSIGAENNCFRVSYALNETGNGYLENHVYPSEGDMDENVFTAYLDKTFSGIDQNITSQKKNLGAGSNKLSLLFTPVYALTKDMAGRSFFDYVVLYEEEEFDKVMETFEYLYNQYLTSSYNTRDYYVFLEKLLSCIPETSSIKAENRSDLEVFRLFEGRDCFINEYPGVRLKDISDKKYTTEQYRSFLSDFAMKYEKLLEIQKAPYKYTSIINGNKYYWIPIEYLP